MRTVRSVLVLCLCVLMAAPGGAQTPQSSPKSHVVDSTALDAAVAARVQNADADRALVRQVLSRAEVRDVAARAGLDIKRAEAAIATLDAEELQQVASRARDVDNALSGGATTIVITTTTIIIILLLIIIIVLLAD
jgi:hypothetical protein